jgi:hypothetical protein
MFSLLLPMHYTTSSKSGLKSDEHDQLEVDA